jgi:hypothetical protein
MMLPKLISNETNISELVNYSDSTYKKQYEIEGVIYYFCVHPEFYADMDGLDFTGNMFIVLLHPNGLSHFIMSFNPEKNSWEPDDIIVETSISSTILKLISDSIIERNK